MVTICTIAFGLAVMAVALCHGPLAHIAFAAPLMMVVGFNWVIVPTNFNIATQRSVPGWVKGRAIAMYMTVLFGSFALGSPIWGAVASRVGISNALLIAGGLVCLGSLLALPFPLTRARGHDFTPAGRPAPSPDARPAAESGLLEVAIDYSVDRARAGDFVRLMHHEIRRQRLRNGATRWHLKHDKQAEGTDGVVLYRETFVFDGWTDLMRFHARTTKTDAAAEDRAREFVVGGGEPPVAYRSIANPRPQPAEWGTPLTSSRHLPHPAPVVDMNHLVTRMFETVEDTVSRVYRDAEKQRARRIADREYNAQHPSPR
jgi:hypothetical protein